ncbi:hypothetical protein D1O30_02215 [Methylocystis hirsuta]|uniref:Uncharacterized protein n=1 Tax=Methylocystis hirsuta TaxID=369798 RepID=A0A3M9XNE7_9HYPH|nr:hypothetical protein D1O30_02215 [Methylocystis hirsuta]
MVWRGWLTETPRTLNFLFWRRRSRIRQCVHKPDDKPAPDAVIFATRLDMAPDGMVSMTSMQEWRTASRDLQFRRKFCVARLSETRCAMTTSPERETLLSTVASP